MTVTAVLLRLESVRGGGGRRRTGHLQAVNVQASPTLPVGLRAVAAAGPASSNDLNHHQSEECKFLHILHINLMSTYFAYICVFYAIFSLKIHNCGVDAYYCI